MFKAREIQIAHFCPHSLASTRGWRFAIKETLWLLCMRLMIRRRSTNRRFNSPALYAFGALLCLCFSLGDHSEVSTKAFVKNGFSSSHNPDPESTISSPRWSARFVLAPHVSIRGAMRDKHSPLHPVNIPPERMSGLSINSSRTPLKDFADIRSLIFLSPLQDRAPPCFA
jgi:hypothetical protein